MSQVQLLEKIYSNEIEENLKLILSTLEDGKALDLQVIDLEGKTNIAKYMVITSGRSGFHAGGLAQKLIKSLKESKVKYISVEGLTESQWILIDLLDIIINIFHPGVREIYNLEKMWKI